MSTKDHCFKKYKKNGKSQVRKCVKQLMEGEYEYRNLNGSHNNTSHPEWGRSNIELVRKLPVAYNDDISTPGDYDRPNVRDVSNAICAHPVEPTPNIHNVSAYFWLWGQFVDHSITLSETTDEHYDIEIPKGDPWFDPQDTGDKVMSFTRSVYNTDTGTSEDNPRQQINQISCWLDASMVYGSDNIRSKHLRLFKDGQLKTSTGDLLPISDGKIPNAGSTGSNIFIAGDVRSNEQLGLTSLHNLFVREHNCWARTIRKYYPNLCDEDVYQKAKIMVEAEIQSITYNEFLPILIGDEWNSKYTGYDSDVNPGIVNCFSAASYRLGHSMVSANIQRVYNPHSPYYGIYGDLELRDAFFSPYRICNEGGIDPILKGWNLTSSEQLDRYLIDDLRNFLFGPPGSGGLDLACLNLQRGRDHGLASYNTAREVYGLSKLESFDELTSDAELQSKLEELYGSLDKLDLWIGGLIECGDSSNDENMLGPLFQKIIGDQFERLRNGDRFWYENRMTKDQIKMINRTKLSDVIKRNTHCNDIPDDIFHFVSTYSDC